MARRSLTSTLLNSKLVSVLLAVALWVYVVGVRGPDTTKSVEAQVVAVNAPRGYVVVGSLPTVTITLRGPMSTLWNLTSEYVTPTADLRGRTAESLVVPVDVAIVGLKSVTVESVNPKDVNIQLEQLESLSIPVHAEFSGTLPQNMALGVIRVEPTTVEVSGPSSLVSQVQEAVVSVALDKIQMGTTGTVTIAGDVVVFDATGHAIDDLLLSPRTAIAVLPVLDTASQKTVPVIPSLSGHLATGHAVSGSTCTPAVITITGTPAVLSQIQAIVTNSVDVTGQDATITREVELSLPSGVSAVEGLRAVTCKIVIEEVLVIAVPDIKLEVRGAEAGWKVTPATGLVSVLVSGTESVIKSLRTSQVLPYVDVSKPPLADGTYMVLVDGLTQGIVSCSINPPSVAVDIQKGP